MVSVVKKSSGGRLVALYFVLFFATIVVVNSIFLYMAITTHTGVVIKDYYEAGLAYDEVLEKARSQPKLHDEVSYSDGVLRWKLVDVDNSFIEGAKVSAKVIRPVQDGYDFDVILLPIGDGVYEVSLSLPLKGAWEIRLSSKWSNKQYQTIYQIIEK